MSPGGLLARACLLTSLVTLNLRAAGENSGPILYERFLGSANTLGNVFRLDSTAGYMFNKHLTIDGGVPVFFVRPSSSATAPLTNLTQTNSIGNVYLEVRFTAANRLLNFGSTLTGTAPTGDKSSGLSTGRATVDWTNHFDRRFFRLTPFVNVGFANAVSDTPLFIRPYTTLGFVTHVDGGAAYRLTRFVDVGASAYAIDPAGQQTVVSRLVTQTMGKAGSLAGNRGRNNHSGVFETTPTVVGTADLARDNGFSVWGGVHPSKAIALQVGYTRSAQYALDTLSFGIGFNLGAALRDMWSY